MCIREGVCIMSAMDQPWLNSATSGAWRRSNLPFFKKHLVADMLTAGLAASQRASWPAGLAAWLSTPLASTPSTHHNRGGPSSHPPTSPPAGWGLRPSNLTPRNSWKPSLGVPPPNTS